MADDKNANIIHNHQVDAGGHPHAFQYLKNHMGESEFRQLVHTTQNSDNHVGHFTFQKDGKDVHYVLEPH